MVCENFRPGFNAQLGTTSMVLDVEFGREEDIILAKQVAGELKYISPFVACGDLRLVTVA